MDLRGKQVLVLGLGESGLAMARWLDRLGACVRVADSRPLAPKHHELAATVPAAVCVNGPWDVDTFADVVLIALSPGVPVQDKYVQAALAQGIPVVSEIELFARAVQQWTPKAQILAITGSNGKTTTTRLLGVLAAAAGRSVKVAGNIGPAALDALMEAQDAGVLPDLWVLELSSFQLETTHNLSAHAAAILNISEDHLDRYADLSDYAAAKARIFTGAAFAVINRQDARCMAMASALAIPVCTFGLDAPPAEKDYGLLEGYLVRGAERLLAISDLALPGLHNVANVMAALALLAQVGISVRLVLSALCAFRGLPHRMAWVARLADVDYYDDSKGTNVGATVAAISGLGRPVAVILGGDGKGQDFSPLRPVLQAHARAVALIGRDAERIAAAALDHHLPVRRCADMAEAVAFCAQQAQPGDAVLLSPACASFDMYSGYVARAADFVAAVQQQEHARC